MQRFAQRLALQKNSCRVFAQRQYATDSATEQELLQQTKALFSKRHEKQQQHVFDKQATKSALHQTKSQVNQFIQQASEGTLSNAQTKQILQELQTISAELEKQGVPAMKQFLQTEQQGLSLEQQVDAQVEKMMQDLPDDYVNKVFRDVRVQNDQLKHALKDVKLEKALAQLAKTQTEKDFEQVSKSLAHDTIQQESTEQQALIDQGLANATTTTTTSNNTDSFFDNEESTQSLFRDLLAATHRGGNNNNVNNPALNETSLPTQEFDQLQALANMYRAIHAINPKQVETPADLTIDPYDEYRPMLAEHIEKRQKALRNEMGIKTGYRGRSPVTLHVFRDENAYDMSNRFAKMSEDQLQNYILNDSRAFKLLDKVHTQDRLDMFMGNRLRHQTYTDRVKRRQRSQKRKMLAQSLDNTLKTFVWLRTYYKTFLQ